MRSYLEKFLKEEDGVETIAVLCILACAVVLIGALAALGGKLDDMAAGAKNTAVISDKTTGYGNVRIK